MDSNEIKLDMKWFDDLLANVNGTQMNLFDDNLITSSAASTISTAASGNIYPYVVTSTGTGNYTLPPVPPGLSNVNPGLNLSFNDHWDYNTKPGLTVKGDAAIDGDIKLKGKSLSETLDKIEERLAILHPNETLEAKWEELKKLGDMYRNLEKDIIEKEKIWNTLKK
jgi:hypothetical protein